MADRWHYEGQVYVRPLGRGWCTYTGGEMDPWQLLEQLEAALALEAGKHVLRITVELVERDVR